MSKFAKFMKKNKVVKENTTYPATKSLLDENGEPLLWTIKPLTSKDNDKITEECMTEVPVPGKPNIYRPKLDVVKYNNLMVCSCVVEPNLYDAELQDSYGVKTPEELIKEMIDDPNEFQALANFIQNYSGLETPKEKVDEAKN